jgi:hypothetical protein
MHPALRVWLIFAAAVALVWACAYALGRPPENADPEYAPWFQSLRAKNGGGCCSQSDCRAVEYRIAADHYEVLIGKQFGDEVEPHWEAVPPESVLQKHDNPTGRAIACWTPYTEPRLLCFVRPAES